MPVFERHLEKEYLAEPAKIIRPEYITVKDTGGRKWTGNHFFFTPSLTGDG